MLFYLDTSISKLFCVGIIPKKSRSRFYCMSQTSLSCCLRATVNVLMCVMDNWICFPVTADRTQRIKQGYDVYKMQIKLYLI